MVKLVKVPQKLFGDTAAAAEIGVFGSFAAGSPTTTTDPNQVQSLANFSAGWVAAILGNNSPAIEDMNALFFLAFRQVAYLMQAGVSEWDAETNYYIGSIININGVLYKSLTDNNLNNEITDGAKWKEMVQEDELLEVQPNRISSGKTRTTSNQSQFIKPDGAAASFTVEGLTTDLEYRVNNLSGVISTDIVKSGLTLAPGAGNTCLVNDSDAAAQEFTRTWGEKGAQKEYILIDTIGANITSLVGKWACFKISTEYFLGFVEADRISRIYRGYFTSSAGIPFNRVTFSDNAVITLMSSSWVFADVDGVTIDVTYNNPVWSPIEPPAPSVGDYWFDIVNKKWKKDNTGFADSNKTLIGVAIIDTANCVAARSFDFYSEFSNDNNLQLDIESVSVIKERNSGSTINIYGTELRRELSALEWDIANDLATSVDMYNSTEQLSTFYYLYLDKDLDEIVSDISPYYRPDLKGYYHPHNTWRCVGKAYNDGSSNFTTENNNFMTFRFNPISKWENNYSARITSGAGAVTSQGGENELGDKAIESIASGGTGVVDITFKTGFFSEIPKVIASVDDGSPTIAATISTTLTFVSVKIFPRGSGTINAPINLSISRQNDDNRR